MISLNYIREVRIMAMEFREKDLDLQNIRKNLDSLITYKSEIVNENAKNSQKKSSAVSEQGSEVKRQSGYGAALYLSILRMMPKDSIC